MVGINTNYLKTIISPNRGNSGKTKSEALDGKVLFDNLANSCNNSSITQDMAKLLLSSLEAGEAGKTTDEFYGESSSGDAKNQDLLSKYNGLSNHHKTELNNLSKQWLKQKENFRPSLFCLNTTKSYMAAIDLLKLVAEGKVNQKVSRYGTSFSGGLRVYSTTYKLANPSLQEGGQINSLPVTTDKPANSSLQEGGQINSLPVTTDKPANSSLQEGGQVNSLPVTTYKLANPSLQEGGQVNSLPVDCNQSVTVIYLIKGEQNNSRYGKVKLNCEAYRRHVNSIKGILESNASDPRNILDDLSLPRVGEEFTGSVRDLIAVLHAEGIIYSLERIMPDEVKTAKYDFVSGLLSIIKCNIEKENLPLSNKITQLEGELEVLSKLNPQGNGFIESDSGAVADSINSSIDKTSEVGVAKLEISKQNNLNYNCLGFIYMIAIADNPGKLDEWFGDCVNPSTDDMLSTIKTECEGNKTIIDLVAILEGYKEFICGLPDGDNSENFPLH